MVSVVTPFQSRITIAGSKWGSVVDGTSTSDPCWIEPGAEPPDAAPLQFKDVATCVRADDDAPVPVALFRIEQAPPIQIDVSAMSARNATFAPRIDLLDREYRVVRSIPFSAFQRRGVQYTATVFLNPADNAVALLALVPDATAFGKEDRSTVGQTDIQTIAIPVGAGVVFWNVLSGSETLTRSWLSEVGLFRIVAERYDPAATR